VTDAMRLSTARVPSTITAKGCTQRRWDMETRFIWLISILPAKGCKYGTVTKTSVTEVRTEMRQPEKYFSR
jgi:hypothetical protein